MMKRTIAILSLTLITFFIQAQVKLLHEYPDDFSVQDNFGPNQSHFLQVYTGFGIPLGPQSDSALIKIPASCYLDFGVRYKKRISNFLAVGLDLNTRVDFYRLKQNASKTIPDTLIYDRQNVNFYKLGLGAYIRFNLDARRGNYLGKYIDFGIRGYYVYSVIETFKIIDDDGIVNDGTKRKVDYYEPYNYCAYTRIGYNMIAITASYRLSNLFKTSSGFPEFPLYSIGIELPF